MFYYYYTRSIVYEVCNMYYILYASVAYKRRAFNWISRSRLRLIIYKCMSTNSKMLFLWIISNSIYMFNRCDILYLRTPCCALTFFFDVWLLLPTKFDRATYLIYFRNNNNNKGIVIEKVWWRKKKRTEHHKAGYSSLIWIEQ